MSLLKLDNITLSLGGPPILDGVDLLIRKKERICLMGRNGEGKTTLMRLIDGEIVPDSGDVIRDRGLRIARLPQDVPVDLQGTVAEAVATGGETATHEDRDADINVQRAVSRVGLDPDTDVATLSSGMKRRVLLARALARDPDLLLLDEPTNHMDIDAINWLEGFLGRFDGSVIFVTHDRAFLRAVSTRIIELDRGRLRDWSCDYDTFLVRREDTLRDEARQRELFDRKLAQEEIWIRQGVRERRTRNEGRVRALMKMRERRQNRRETSKAADFSLQDSDRSGKLVLQAENICFSRAETPVIRDFSVRVMRGDKIGIIGANGTGKTALLRLLLGDLQADSGSVRRGTNLTIAYYDQLRETLDPTRTVQQNVNAGNETVHFNGRPMHVITYLQTFLFTPDRARTPITHLSGGELNRLLLARLFTLPANLLVLDEPTNDLDLETLELLEELLGDFPGTALLVSHDRTFLDNIVTSTLAFDGDGVFREYIGGYSDWLRMSKADAAPAPGRRKSPGRKPKSASSGPRRLSYRENRELEELPAKIEDLETRLESLNARLSDPALYRDAGAEVSGIEAERSEIERRLETHYERWAELEELK